MNAGEVVPIVVHGGVDGVVDAVVGILITAVVVPVGDGSFGNGGELDDIAVAHRIILGDGIGAHIVHGGRFEIAQPVDTPCLVEIFRSAVVCDLGIRILAPAESLLDDI